MSDKYQNKYRIASSRMQNWDYRWSGAYFITICTQNRERFFGVIENEKIILSHAGILADVFWHEIKHHANNIELGDFVVMPNHIHGILILNGANGDDVNPNQNATMADVANVNGHNVDGHNTNGTNADGDNADSDNVDGDNVDGDNVDGDNVETRHALSLQSQIQIQSQLQSPQPSKTIGQQRFQNQGKNSVSSIIGSYKSAVTKHADRLQLPFGWQPRFHEHIIRNADEYNRISYYIINNIRNWKEDKFYDDGE